MSPIALRHRIVIPGMVLPWVVPPREVQQMTTKFWGVVGESRIEGKTAGRTLEIPVLVYDEDGALNTRQKLSRFLDDDCGRILQGQTATLVVESEADRPAFNHATFDGLVILEGPKLDVVGNLGGGAWAGCVFLFRQHQ